MKFQYMFEVQIYKIIGIATTVLSLLLLLIPILTKNPIWLIIPILLFVSSKNITSSFFANDKKLMKEKKYLLKNGSKCDGKIIGYKKHRLLNQMFGLSIKELDASDSDVYTLIIEFNGKTFETPSIVNNPQKLFASEKCVVYYDDDKTYATDFDIANNENFLNIPEFEDNNE